MTIMINFLKMCSYFLSAINSKIHFLAFYNFHVKTQAYSKVTF